jgi:hypothetical protein
MTPEEAKQAAEEIQVAISSSKLSIGELQKFKDPVALFAWLLKEKGESAPSPEQVATILSFSPKVAIGLHGIRTHAAWIRSFSDVASRHSWRCLQDKWNFGFYNILKFLNGWSRGKKIHWFRVQYHTETHDTDSGLEDGLPSIVCHSFGTYILGYSLLRYDYIKFNRVILCGSILPVDFAWDKIIARGQVQSVRNEYSPKDFWAKHVRHCVRGTGQSGVIGFSCRHERLIQEEFQYDHSEYFEKGHMASRWIPFLDRFLPAVQPSTNIVIPHPATKAPLLVKAIYISTLFAIVAWCVWRFVLR